MAQMKVSGFTNPSSGTGATNVDMGFQVDSIMLYNRTAGGIFSWNSSMADGSYFDVDAGTYTSTNGFTPLSQSSIYGAAISAFTNANPGVITASYIAQCGIVAGDTIVVAGLADDGSGTSLNATFTVASVTGTTITLDQNTSAYSVYVSGGFAVRKLDSSGAAVPTQNFSIQGLTFGTSVIGANSDVITYVAMGSNSVV